MRIALGVKGILFPGSCKNYSVRVSIFICICVKKYCRNVLHVVVEFSMYRMFFFNITFR